MLLIKPLRCKGSQHWDLLNSMRAQMHAFIKCKESSAQWIYTSMEGIYTSKKPCILLRAGFEIEY